MRRAFIMRRGGAAWLAKAEDPLTAGGVGGMVLAVLLWAAPAAAAGEEVYERAARSAGAVLLFKPVEQDPQRLETVLAPFVLQSTALAAGEVEREGAAFGMRLDHRRGTNPVVYFRAGKMSWGGVVHTQMMYLWLYAESREGEALPVQGVRITLDRQGFPVIWEMLAAPHDRREVYVAGSVEHGSLRRFGGRLGGRRYAVEPAKAEAPELVMPLVVEDSPVVFGPMVYLERGTRGPHAVICRCMPALATQIVDTVTYELEAWPEEALRRIEQRGDSRRMQKFLEDFERRPPAQQLRLPAL